MTPDDYVRECRGTALRLVRARAERRTASTTIPEHLMAGTVMSLSGIAWGLICDIALLMDVDPGEYLDEMVLADHERLCR